VVVELAWVPFLAYELDRRQLIEAFEALLRPKELVVERPEVVWKASRTVQSSSADFADCLISGSAMAAGCAETMTFDRAAAKGTGMTLIT